MSPAASIRKSIFSAIKKLAPSIKPEDFVVEHSEIAQHGDYSSNAALVLAPTLSRKPFDMARELKEELKKDKELKKIVEKIEAAPPGFINFWLGLSFLQAQVGEILKAQDKYGSSQIGKGKYVRIEFISANPTGPLHIGNARGGPLGDVLANILEKAGYKVLREYLNNDLGGQIKALGSTIKALVEGQKPKVPQYQGEYIGELVELLKNKIQNLGEEEIGKLAADILFKEIMRDVKDMGIKFDLVVKESELREKAAQIIENLKQKKVLKEKEGALWFAPSDEFLKDRETVLVKSDGSYTYFTADIVYHKEKFESGADLIIDIFGSNHAGHVPRLQAAAKALGFDPGRLKFILYQYVRVKRGKKIVSMSKRAGTLVTAREVLDEVGQDAFRFFLLKTAPETHIDFDLDLAKKQAQNNPVYYVQYAHARIASILRKAREQDSKTARKTESARLLADSFNLLSHSSELKLIKELIRLPETVERITKTFEVQILPQYAIDLAESFHAFYRDCRVISADRKLTQARLALCRATQIVLANTLKLMGIGAPERM